MNFLNKLSVAKKIYLIPLIGIVSFAFYLALTSWVALKNVSILDDAKDVQFPALQHVDKSLVMFDRVKEILSGAVTTGDEEGLINANNTADRFREEISKVKVIAPGLSSTVNNIVEEFNAYYAIAFDVSQSMVNNTADFATLPEKSMKMNELFDQTRTNLNNLSKSRLKAFSDAIQEANVSASRMVTVGVFTAIASAILLFAISIPVVRGIKRSLDQVVDSLRDIAQEDGDLTIRIRTGCEDEIGELVQWFNSFMEKLQGVIKDIVDSALPLSELAQDLNQLTDETNQTIDVQTTRANDAKRAVDTMNASVIEVAQSAAQAASSASDASNAAQQGRTVVNSTVSSIQALSNNVAETADVIQKLESDSNQVGVVLDVIKGIAEQTNLLALNAAIEAARAGEQGRGFAVVADEVRTLASRTQQSTEEIQATIEQLQNAARSAVKVMSKGTEQATDSVETANKAGDSLKAITETISSISAMNEQIAQSTDNQQQVANNIVGYVDDIYNSTQQTSGNSSRLANVSSELADLARNLEAIARQFKV